MYYAGDRHAIIDRLCESHDRATHDRPTYDRATHVRTTHIRTTHDRTDSHPANGYSTHRNS